MKKILLSVLMSATLFVSSSAALATTYTPYSSNINGYYTGLTVILQVPNTRIPIIFTTQIPTYVKPGDTLTLKWESQEDFSKVNLDLVYYQNGDKVKTPLLKGSRNKGSYKWKVGKNLVNGRTYFLDIADSAKGSLITGYSNQFVFYDMSVEGYQSQLAESQTRAKDAAIKSYLNNMRAQAALYSDVNNMSAKKVCSTPVSKQGIKTMVEEVKKLTSHVDCDDSADSFAVETKLSDGTYYCVDLLNGGKISTRSKGSSGKVCK